MNVIAVLGLGFFFLVAAFALYLVAINCPRPLDIPFFVLAVLLAVAGCIIWLIPIVPLLLIVSVTITRTREEQQFDEMKGRSL
ncbi:hypothetical protein KBA63_03005 [Candidatus Woesebacteria bacterium]|nr:hypothetical protein [Candidatus Woesebacteria bacterium]MBP9687226.1 hypothetical protein [Candidatus Woesebacteria bacterium]